MRNILFTIIFMIAWYCAQAQAAPVDSSVIVYRFKNYSLVLLNESLSDSLSDQPGVTPSSKTRAVYITEGMFSIFLTTNKEPFLHRVNKVILDSGTIEPIAIEDIEMKSGIIEDNRYTDWKNAKNFTLFDTTSTDFPLIKGKLSLTKGDYYVLFQLFVGTHGTRIINIRNKKTGEELVNFRLKIIDKPVTPFLMLVAKDKADEKLIDSFQQKTSPRTIVPDIKAILEGRKPKPAPEAPEISMVLNNENLKETSGLVLYFRKERDHYGDSSLEYRLWSEANEDTNWIKTGHKLIVPHLGAGTHYKLQVRYQTHPGFIQEHTFFTVPKWYQTTLTKTIIAGILIAGILLTWLLVYRQRLYKSRTRREQLSLEIKSIRSQLNPHFVFNALASIQALINKNDIASANRYLTEFSTLLRESLHNSEKEMVPLATEVKLLETYLKLEQLRFNFKYAIEIDETLNINNTEIPTLVLQPLVENAVKHGVSTLGEKGFIKIDFIKRKNDLLVSIIDNGNNFDTTKTSEGFGLKLTRSRISLLSETVKEQPIRLSIERREGRETVVNLIFTNWL
jgi:two-component sensor histidine kinase